MTLGEYRLKECLPEWVFVDMIREISVMAKNGNVRKIQRRRNRICAHLTSQLVSVTRTETFGEDAKAEYSVVVRRGS